MFNSGNKQILTQALGSEQWRTSFLNRISTLKTPQILTLKMWNLKWTRKWDGIETKIFFAFDASVNIAVIMRIICTHLTGDVLITLANVQGQGCLKVMNKHSSCIVNRMFIQCYLLFNNVLKRLERMNLYIVDRNFHSEASYLDIRLTFFKNILLLVSECWENIQK